MGDTLFASVMWYNESRRGNQQRREQESIREYRHERQQEADGIDGGGSKDEGSIRMQGGELTRATEFKYLGSTIQEDRGADKEVRRRIHAVRIAAAEYRHVTIAGER